MQKIIHTPEKREEARQRTLLLESIRKVIHKYRIVPKGKSELVNVAHKTLQSSIATLIVKYIEKNYAYKKTKAKEKKKSTR